MYVYVYQCVCMFRYMYGHVSTGSGSSDFYCHSKNKLVTLYSVPKGSTNWWYWQLINFSNLPSNLHHQDFDNQCEEPGSLGHNTRLKSPPTNFFDFWRFSRDQQSPRLTRNRWNHCGVVWALCLVTFSRNFFKEKVKTVLGVMCIPDFFHFFLGDVWPWLCNESTIWA